MKQMLFDLKCLDLYGTFMEHEIVADDLITLTSDELEDMGVDSENTQRFLLAVKELPRRKRKEKEENERKESLKQHLTKMNCLDLLEIFYKNGVLGDNLTKLNQETLREFGVKVGARKHFLKEMQNIKEMQNLKGTQLHGILFS